MGAEHTGHGDVLDIAGIDRRRLGQGAAGREGAGENGRQKGVFTHECPPFTAADAAMAYGLPQTSPAS